MNGPWIIAGGFAVVAFATLLAMNTSMGGTRSDCDDGSGFIAGAGALVFLAGIAVTAVEIFT